MDTQNKKPDMLYHYTDIKGLMGIIKTNSIWATNIFYLNDAAEYEYPVGLISMEIEQRIKGSEIIVSEIKEKIKKEPDITDNNKKLLKEEAEKKYCYRVINSIITEIEHYHIYIFSFSEKGDQLSQWRGYCPGGNGFSVGFKALDLERQMKKYEFVLVQCVYDKDIQNDIIRNELDKWPFGRIEEVRKKYERSKKLDKYEGLEGVSRKDKAGTLAFLDVASSMINNIPKIKHPSFQEEVEWRLYSHIGRDGINKIKLREGKSMIVPYYVIPLKDKESEVKVSHIRIGPTPHPELSLRSVKELLRLEGYKRNECHVEISNVTYRAL